MSDGWQVTMTISDLTESVAEVLAKRLAEEWAEPGNGVTVKAEELAKAESAMKVWVVMEQWVHDDDGDSAIDCEAVHLSEAGANANLEPDYSTSGHRPFTRERYVVEMEVLP